MKSDFEETPFDNQMQDDLQSRRAQPTHTPVRIGPTGPDTSAPAPSDRATPDLLAPGIVTPTAPDTDTVLPVPKEKVPMPVIVGLAMALGAVCVVGASIGMKRAIKPLDPVYPTVTALPPSGDEIMQAPDTVIKNPDTSRSDDTMAPSPETPSSETPGSTTPGSTTPSSAASSADAVPDATPSVEINALPPVPKVATPPKDNPAPGATASPGTYPPADTHRSAQFEITPPPGFALRQSGRRTIWQRDDGAQILVETGKAGEGSLRSGWQKLDRDLARRYGERYRSLGIRDGTLAGQPAAIWEFELTGKDGVTRRKTDIGIKVNGRGYAVLGSAPKDKFGSVSGELQQALDSFRVKSTEEPQPKPTPGTEQNGTDTGTESPAPRATWRPRVRPTTAPTAPEPSSPVPLPEKKQETEKGY